MLNVPNVWAHSANYLLIFFTPTVITLLRLGTERIRSQEYAAKMSSQQVAGNNLEEETGWRMMDEDQRRGHHTSQVDEQEPSLSERQAFDSRVDEETGWRLLDAQDQRLGGADLREDENSQFLDDKFDEVQLGGQEQQPQEKPETYQQQLDVVSDQQKAAIKHYFEAESEKVFH